MSKATSRNANKPYAISAYTAKELVEALRRMYLIRRFEEKAEECYMRGLIHGTMHLSIGQDHLHPSRPWPLCRQGSGCGQDVRRVFWQGNRILPRSRRIHAHCRCRKGQSWR